jgi:hypothetical protein
METIKYGTHNSRCITPCPYNRPDNRGGIRKVGTLSCLYCKSCKGMDRISNKVECHFEDKPNNK